MLHLIKHQCTQSTLHQASFHTAGYGKVGMSAQENWKNRDGPDNLAVIRHSSIHP